MNILVTGNNGYIGSVLTGQLIDQGYNVTGLDTNYFDGCEFGQFGSSRSNARINQIKKDIRYVTADDLKGIDAIVHLAALSNEHLCEIQHQMTYEINYKATATLAALAKKVGVKRFLFSSSQNVYDTKEGQVDEETVLNPKTPYGESKLLAEKSIATLADDSFSPIILRPAAVFGTSLMQRLDIVLNSLVAWAYTTGKIRIMSDGLGYRSLIHVEDLAHAFIIALKAPKRLVHKQIFNVGTRRNYQIIELAGLVKEQLPHAEILFTYEYPKTIKHIVNTEKFHRELRRYYHSKWNIEKGIAQLLHAFGETQMTAEHFLGNKYIRINHMKKLLSEKKLNKYCHWTKPEQIASVKKIVSPAVSMYAA